MLSPSKVVFVSFVSIKCQTFCAHLHARSSMKRHQKFFIFAFMVVSAYLSARKLVDSPFFAQHQSTKSLHAHIPQIKFLLDVLPWYSLVLFGCYCLGKLGIDMLSFRDCPQDIPKLAEVIIDIFTLAQSR